MKPIDDAPLVISSYGDMASRPRFRDNVDPTAHEPADILAEYHFPDEVACGLSVCHQGHKFGVLIVTKDDIETNIGNKCGAIHFPEQFDTIRKSFTVRRQRAAHMDVIGEYRAKRDDYEAIIDVLWSEERGARWALGCAKAYREQCPQSVKDKLFAMAKSGDWSLYIEKRVKKDDATGLGFRRDELFEQERVGELRGGNAFKMSARDILKPLRDKMREYDQIVDPSQLTAYQRRQWAQFARSIPVTLEDARVIGEAARVLYTRENLSQLLKVVRDQTDARGVRAFIDAVGRVELSVQRHAG